MHAIVHRSTIAFAMSSASPAAAATPAAAAPAAIHRPFNFNAGPAALPDSVLREVQRDLMDYAGTGMSVMELSHRSHEFEAIMRQTEADARRILSIPASYKIILMQGGGTTQFSAVPLNLCSSADQSAQYLVTGAWSAAAQAEAAKFCVATPMAALPKQQQYTALPSIEQVKQQLSAAAAKDAAFIYACANETVHGVEWGEELEQLFEPLPTAAGASAAAAAASSSAAATAATPASPVLVSDMSSSFMSRPIDVSRYGLIYAGAQKNVGPAGVTVVIVHESLLARKAQQSAPLMLHYAQMASKDSMYNTPPTFAIYVMSRVFSWILSQGGLEALGERNATKAAMLYKAIDESGGFYRAFVTPESKARSRMNVVFTVNKPVAASPEQPASSGRDDALNARFVSESEAAGFVGLAGHRSVGGLRASLYNAVSIEAVQALVAFMQAFRSRVTGAGGK